MCQVTLMEKSAPPAVMKTSTAFTSAQTTANSAWTESHSPYDTTSWIQMYEYHSVYTIQRMGPVPTTIYLWFPTLKSTCPPSGRAILTLTMERSTLIIVHRWQHPFEEEGSGVSCYWRVTNLISKNNRMKETACANEGLQLKQMVGWSMNQSIALVDHEFFANENNVSSDIGQSSI